jgi:hypothetical protein
MSHLLALRSIGRSVVRFRPAKSRRNEALRADLAAFYAAQQQSFDYVGDYIRSRRPAER